MIAAGKYRKKAVIVTAFGVPPGDYGTLGSFSTDGVILQLVDTSLHTLEESAFLEKYEQTTYDATLTGTDWD